MLRINIVLLLNETNCNIFQDVDDCAEVLEIMPNTAMTELNEGGDYTDCELQELLHVQRRTRVCNIFNQHF